MVAPRPGTFLAEAAYLAIFAVQLFQEANVVKIEELHPAVVFNSPGSGNDVWDVQTIEVFVYWRNHCQN